MRIWLPDAARWTSAMLLRSQRKAGASLGWLAAVMVASILAMVGPARAQDEKVAVEVVPSATAVAPGGELVVAVVFDHAEGFHVWPSVEQDVLGPEFGFAIRTRIDVVGGAQHLGWRGPTQWPALYQATVADPSGQGTTTAPTYAGRAVAMLPMRLASNATGSVAIELEIEYQACNDSICLAPEMTTRTVRVSADASAASALPASLGPDFAKLDRAVFQQSAAPAPPAPEASQAERPASGAQAQAAPSGRPGESRFLGLQVGAGLIGLALFAALGGLVLNLTPCVLPVIPLKVMALSKHAGSPGRTLYLGLWMAAGVVAFWLALGVIAALFTSWADPSRVFGIWWVTAGIGALIALMGVGIMGAFTITLPQQLYMINPKADSAGGSFLFGVMTAVLGLPCFGFVAGGLLVGAASMPKSHILTVFFSLGVGMAAPYLVLAMFPKLVERIPRTGPGSELVKQVLGLLLMAAAAYFVGAGLIGLVSEQPWLGRQLHWWAIALLVWAASAWMVLRTFQITRKLGLRAATLLLGAAFAAVVWWQANNLTVSARRSYEVRQAALQEGDGPDQLIAGAWLEYSPKLLQRALEADRTVVLDFTAEWCLNCKALKAAVLNAEPVKSRLSDGQIITITADLTSRKAPGWKKLAELGQTGIPLLVIYGPGQAEPWMSNAYTAEQVLGALDRAKKLAGDTASAAGDSRP